MKKAEVQNNLMQKTLLGFYFKKCFLGLYKYIFLYLFLKLLDGSGAVVFPFVERWIVTMFEGAPLGMAIYHHVMPTIALLVGINMGFSTISIMLDYVSSILWPYMNKQLSSILTDYVHMQSMSFWINRMAGSINSNIGFVNTGAETLVNNVWTMVIRVIMIGINSTLLFTVNKYIAFIPQEPAMFNRTIKDNITYGRPDATMTEIKDAARFASADKFINSTEKKYDTVVGDRGIKMSGGQRQRIAIARAFLKDAPILILDEATSALDSETEVAIQHSFEKLSHNRTTIAIAHRLSTLRNMDRIVVLDGGKIVESGTHKALLRRGGEYAKLWKMQSGGFLQEDKDDKKE